jgi:hypothetical protein
LAPAASTVSGSTVVTSSTSSNNNNNNVVELELKTIEELEQEVKAAVQTKNMPLAMRLSLEIVTRKSIEAAASHHRNQIGIRDIQVARDQLLHDGGGTS